MVSEPIEKFANLVFLHGWAMPSTFWQPVIDALPCQFRVENLDLPGYRSQIDFDQNYDLETIADNLLNRIPFEQFTLVGWSLGGTIAIKLGLIAPERVRQVQLVGTTPCFLNRQDWAFGKDATSFQQLSDQFASDYRKGIKRFVSLQTHDPNPGNAKASRGLAKNIIQQVFESPQPCHRTLMSGLQILADTDLRNEVHNLKMPIQVLSGTRDQVVPPQAGKWLADQIPKAESLILLGAGHLPFVEQNDEYIKYLTSFVQQDP
ncbi:MAG: alpha/beta fold hydrolase [Planctomycetota bacterium]